MTFIEKICFGRENRAVTSEKVSKPISPRPTPVENIRSGKKLPRLLLFAGTFTASPRNTIVVRSIAHDGGRDIFSCLPTWQAGLAEV